MMIKIYLVENIDNNPNKVYIGKTNTSRKIKHEKNFGKQIKYTEIDSTFSDSKNEWKPLETYWIQQFRAWGFDVLNQNLGGGGPEFHTEEVKSKMRKPKSNKSNYTWNEERKITQSKSHKGIKQSEEWIENRAKTQYKPIKCTTPNNDIINFESGTHCNEYFSKLFNKKTCFGAINNSLKNNRVVNKGKLKSYKFEYVEISK